jgi:glycosyltransferase involved in cell wall biosynthesis
VASHYHGAIANIVPIFYGSGTRVKAIESSLFATACIGTAQGVEGLGLDPERDYFRAESESEWIDALNTLDPDAARQRGSNALERARIRYDRDRIAGELLQLVRDI